MKVLIYSSLAVWNFTSLEDVPKSAGNQTLHQTLLGYERNRIDVAVFTFSRKASNAHIGQHVTISVSKVANLVKRIERSGRKVKARLGLSHRKKAVKTVPPYDHPIIKTGSAREYYLGLIIGMTELVFEYIRYKPDVLYAYEVYASVPMLMLSRLTGKPLVTRYQGTELGFMLGYPAQMYRAKYLWKGTNIRSDLVIMANDGTDGDRVLRHADKVTGKVLFISNGVTNKEGLLGYRMNTEEYRKRMGISHNAIIITSSNRFVDWKRIDRIINIHERLLNDRLDVHLVLVGDGDCKEMLLQMVVDKGIRQSVTFTGVLSHAEALNHIAHCDIYTTLNHSGNLGNSVYEAMTLGKCICTLNNPSVAKILTHGSNALLAEDKDAESAFTMIKNAVTDYELRQMVGVGARQYAEENLRSWEQRMEYECQEIRCLAGEI